MRAKEGIFFVWFVCESGEKTQQCSSGGSSGRQQWKAVEVAAVRASNFFIFCFLFFRLFVFSYFFHVLRHREERGKSRNEKHKEMEAEAGGDWGVEGVAGVAAVAGEAAVAAEEHCSSCWLVSLSCWLAELAPRFVACLLSRAFTWIERSPGH